MCVCLCVSKHIYHKWHMIEKYLRQFVEIFESVDKNKIPSQKHLSKTSSSYAKCFRKAFYAQTRGTSTVHCWQVALMDKVKGKRTVVNNNLKVLFSLGCGSTVE